MEPPSDPSITIKKRRAPLYSLVKVAVTLSLLVLLFTTVGTEAILEGFSDVIWIWVLARLLLYPASLFLQVVRWRILLYGQGVSAPWGLLCQRYWMARFFDNFLPGQIGGDGFRILAPMGIPAQRSAIAASVLLDRLTGMIGLLLYVTVVGLLHMRLTAQVGFGPVLGLGILGLLLLLPWVLLRSPSAWGLKVVGKLSNSKGKSVLLAVLDGARNLALRKRTLALSLLLSVLFHFLTAVRTFFAFLALGIPIPFLSVILLVPLVGLASQIPISINGLGLREGIFVLTFTAIGVPPGEALAVALLSRLTTVFMSSIGGLLYVRGAVKPAASSTV
jgi:glycosyltransferase 2 family protein